MSESEEVRIAKTQEEREAVYRFRYRVYVEELKRDYPDANHEEKWLRDDDDDQGYAVNFYTGRVDDIRPLFNQSDVYIAPFEATHGSKLKIAEAMAMGMPIVTTPSGMRGFPLVDGASVLIARSNEQFAAHVVALLGDVSRRQDLGAAARKLALAAIDWRVLGKRVVQIVESVLKESCDAGCQALGDRRCSLL